MPDVRQDPPPEHPGGQDDEPPTLTAVFRMVLVLLADVDAYLGDFRGDPADLRLRIDSAAHVVRRAGSHLEGPNPP